ncbi:MAG: hypothetical protein ABG776_01060 [Cyanobacteria bacterium J06555_13]
MNWWHKNAEPIESFAAVVTAVVAIAALFGAKVQIDRSDLIQRQQSARDAYRAHLAIAATQPQFSRPTDACSLVQSADGGAYVAYVDHLLYSAEQMLAVENGWSATFLEKLVPHTDYLCSAFTPDIPIGVEVSNLMEEFRAENCPISSTC